MDHVFVGGISVLAFGVVRTTVDVDVVARIPPVKVPMIAAALARAGFRASRQDLEDAIAEGSHCTIQDVRSPFRIDLSPAWTEADRHALRTRRFVRWRRLTLPVAAPEHTIVMKLRYGSEQDLEDATGIYVRQPRLNVRAMRGFARDQRVSKRLAGLERRARSLVRRKRR
ncbi:MAG TPA: hypothetical protein VGR51_10680 [Thermoplasmata archaeon]|nr:hypothetical protein [Thermoplasmata archaeon]